MKCANCRRMKSKVIPFAAESALNKECTYDSSSDPCNQCSRKGLRCAPKMLNKSESNAYSLHSNAPSSKVIPGAENTELDTTPDMADSFFASPKSFNDSIRGLVTLNLSIVERSGFGTEGWITPTSPDSRQPEDTPTAQSQLPKSTLDCVTENQDTAGGSSLRMCLGGQGRSLHNPCRMAFVPR